MLSLVTIEAHRTEHVILCSLEATLAKVIKNALLTCITINVPLPRSTHLFVSHSAIEGKAGLDALPGFDLSLNVSSNLQHKSHTKIV